MNHKEWEKRVLDVESKISELAGQGKLMDPDKGVLEGLVKELENLVEEM